MHQSQYRPKDFCLPNLTSRFHIHQDGRADKRTALVAWNERSPPINRNRCTFGSPHADQLLDTRATLPADNRCHLDTFVESITPLSAGCCITHSLVELMAGFTHRHRPRYCQATLTGTTKCRICNDLHCDIHVSIRHNHDGVLCPTLSLNPLAIFSCAAVYITRYVG